MYSQMGFFDLSTRYEQLSNQGDPLERLNRIMDWKIFSSQINRAFDKIRKSPAGRKPFNRLMMFKVLVLQGLYNLSDAQTEYQIKDRLSFMRFLGLALGDDIQAGYISRIINRTKKFPAHSAIGRENRRRSKMKIGMMNLIYNLCRYEQIGRMGAC